MIYEAQEGNSIENQNQEQDLSVSYLFCLVYFLPNTHFKDLLVQQVLQSSFHKDGALQQGFTGHRCYFLDVAEALGKSG